MPGMKSDAIQDVPRERSRATGIHYTTPLVLISSLLCGICFALGHHIFYEGLNGRPALNEDVILKVSHQRFNLAVGNALAFAVKVSLGIAASTAYYQAFWQTAREAKNGQRLTTLDATFSVLEDATSLFNLNVWYRYPLMFTIAVLAWCIPLASIITPSTLTVQNVLRVPALTSNMEAPNLEFASFDFLAPMIYNGSEEYWQYFGISDAVKRIATTSMVGREILPIAAPSSHGNTSWTINFHGPSLTCGNATQDDERAIWYNVLDSIKPTQTNPPYWPCYELNAYTSWSNSRDSWLPYDEKGDLTLQATSYGTAQRMFVASTPWSAEQFQRLCGFGDQTNIVREIYEKPDSAKHPYLAELFDTASLVECRAVNASYTVHFDYTNGQQTLSINIDKSGESLVPIYNVTGPGPTSRNASEPLAGEAADPNCSTWNFQGERCSFDVTTLRTLSYQAVVDAFSKV